MTDGEWAASLAKRIMGRTGEHWFENGVARAIEVAMDRARKKEREAIVTKLRVPDCRMELTARDKRWRDNVNAIADAIEAEPAKR